jgi:hypothetical protein
MEIELKTGFCFDPFLPEARKDELERELVSGHFFRIEDLYSNFRQESKRTSDWFVLQAAGPFFTDDGTTFVC